MGTDYPTPDGTAIRDYLQAGHDSLVCNLGSGVGYSVHEVVDAVERATGGKVPRETSARRPGDPPALVAAAAPHSLDWQPRNSAIDRIVETAWTRHQSRPATPDQIVA